MIEELAGALSERVWIEAWVPSRDDAGTDVGAWMMQGWAYAAVLPDGLAVPVTAGDAARTRRRWRVLLRARCGLGLTVRLRWRGQILAVLAVEDDPRQPGMVTLRCEGRPA